MPEMNQRPPRTGLEAVRLKLCYPQHRESRCREGHSRRETAWRSPTRDCETRLASLKPKYKNPLPSGGGVSIINDIARTHRERSACWIFLLYLKAVGTSPYPPLFFLPSDQRSRLLIRLDGGRSPVNISLARNEKRLSEQKIGEPLGDQPYKIGLDFMASPERGSAEALGEGSCCHCA
jgi:hypothetical protein